MIRDKTCPACKGRGYIGKGVGREISDYNVIIKCVKCNGIGKIKESFIDKVWKIL